MAAWSHHLRNAVQALQERSDAHGTVTVRFGKVTAVTAGAAADGGPAVSVNIRGDVITAPCLDSYLTPTVGHLVAVQLVDGSPLILGHVVSLPAF